LNSETSLVKGPKSLLVAFLLCLLLGIPLFSKLDVRPLERWDESYNGQLAAVMNLTHEFVAPRRAVGVFETWHTKPAPLIWMQFVFLKFTGFTETALRLPSAISGFLTMLVMIFFFKYRYDNWFPGILASVVLVSTKGYMGYHGVRSADYDGLLTLWMTVTYLAFFIYLHPRDEKEETKALYLSTLASVFTVYSKGVAGLTILPGIFVFTLLNGKIPTLFKRKDFYGLILFFIAAVLGFYYLRELNHSGYIKIMWHEEIWDRFFIKEGRQYKESWDYVKNLYHHSFSPYFSYLPIALIFGIFGIKGMRPKFRKIVLYSMVVVVTHLTILASSETHHIWYIIPLFPMASIIIGVGIFTLCKGISNLKFFTGPKARAIVISLVLIGIFYDPYKLTIKNIFVRSHEYDEDLYSIGPYIKKIIKEKSYKKEYKIVFEAINHTISFYAYALRDRGVKTDFVNKHALKPGDLAIATERTMKTYIEKNYKYKITDKFKSVRVYKIL